MRTSQILEKYHEQPALLDGISIVLITEIMDVVKQICRKYIKDTSGIKITDSESLKDFPVFPKEADGLLHILFVLIKIRGIDKVSKYFPHEAQDFEPLVYSLTTLCFKIHTKWETNYVLMIWLSMILMMPFTLSVLDSHLCDKFFICVDEKQKDIMKLKTKEIKIEDVIVNICKLFLNRTTRVNESASICLGRFFTREDIKKQGY